VSAKKVGPTAGPYAADYDRVGPGSTPGAGGLLENLDPVPYRRTASPAEVKLAADVGGHHHIGISAHQRSGSGIAQTGRKLRLQQ
jgi:hypothetical protein